MEEPPAQQGEQEPQQQVDQAEEQQGQQEAAAEPAEAGAGEVAAAAPAAAGAAAAAAAQQQEQQQQQQAQAEQPPAAAAAAAQAPHAQQQAPAAAAAVAAAGAAAAAQQAAGAVASGAAGEEGPAAKRQRLEREGEEAAPPPPDFSYFPEAEADLVLRTSDGKRVGVHRLIVLRTCGFFRELLEACGGETEVAVAESYGEIKPLLLDIIYDRSVAIQPETAVQIFQLADKYEAPSLMQACRAVFLSDAFKLGIPGEAGAQQQGHCGWMEMLFLASKHKFADLAQRCVDFFLQQCKDAPAMALRSFLRDQQLLPEMQSSDMLSMLRGLANCALQMEGKTYKELQDTEQKLKQSSTEVQALQKKLQVQKQSYMKLLSKHNRLLDKCDKHKVTWHKDLEPASAKKGKKPQGAAAGGGGGVGAGGGGGGGPAAAAAAAADFVAMLGLP